MNLSELMKESDQASLNGGVIEQYVKQFGIRSYMNLLVYFQKTTMSEMEMIETMQAKIFDS